ncbi:unnamed protein product [Victoria cruziana]
MWYFPSPSSFGQRAGVRVLVLRKSISVASTKCPENEDTLQADHPSFGLEDTSLFCCFFGRVLVTEEGGREGMAAHKMVGARKAPSVVKEIFYGITLGLVLGGMWKMHQWKEQRKTRMFYNMLDKGVIDVVVDENK